MFFSFLGEGQTFNLKNTTLNMETHAWVFLVSRRGFLLCFQCFAHEPPAADITETHPARVLSGCVVWETENACLQTIYPSHGVDSLVSKLLIMFSI